MLLLGRSAGMNGQIEIPFPDGERHRIKINRTWHEGPQTACASVLKDAGDDPDVTNGAEIRAQVGFTQGNSGSHNPENRELPRIVIRGGVGVGTVTRPGLPVQPGNPAINPGPEKMIREAVKEALQNGPASPGTAAAELVVTVSVPEGEAIARKTLNARLGIIGGISILGTTGIVRPLSSEAWTATISASMNVAKAMGRTAIVLSSGRSSEKAHMTKYAFPEDAYVMMGDYIEYAFLEAQKHRFRKIHLAAQWAKMLKVAMATPHTHVRHGAIDLEKAIAFLRDFGYGDLQEKEFNTAREILDVINSSSPGRYRPLLSRVCEAARRYAESITNGIPIVAHLVSYEGEIIAHNG
jgi:cobalt-precorrin-5B (C1)-methyltransferase